MIEGTATLEDTGSGSGLGEIVILGGTARGRECYTARQGQGTLLRGKEMGGHHEMGILLSGHGCRAHPEWGGDSARGSGWTLSYWGDIARVSERKGYCQGFREGGPSEMGTLPGNHRSGTHPEWGTLCSIREEYRERGDTPKQGALPRGQDGVHIQGGGRCQGIRTGGTLSHGGILP